MSSSFYIVSFLATALAFGTESPPNLNEPRIKIMPGFPRDGDLPKPIARILPPLTVVSPILYFGFWNPAALGQPTKVIGSNQLVGLFLIGIAHALMIWVQVHCGRFYTFDRSIKKDHKLIQTGPYQYSQNPGYVSMVTTVLGVYVYTLGTYINAFPILIVTIVLSGVPVEEEMMRQEFGKEYEHFQATRKRFVPGLC